VSDRWGNDSEIVFFLNVLDFDKGQDFTGIIAAVPPLTPLTEHSFT
jgi:hypothetical protein